MTEPELHINCAPSCKQDSLVKSSSERKLFKVSLSWSLIKMEFLDNIMHIRVKELDAGLAYICPLFSKDKCRPSLLERTNIDQACIQSFESCMLSRNFK